MIGRIRYGYILLGCNDAGLTGFKVWEYPTVWLWEGYIGLAGVDIGSVDMTYGSRSTNLSSNTLSNFLFPCSILPNLGDPLHLDQL